MPTEFLVVIFVIVAALVLIFRTLFLTQPFSSSYSRINKEDLQNFDRQWDSLLEEGSEEIRENGKEFREALLNNTMSESEKRMLQKSFKKRGIHVY